MKPIRLAVGIATIGRPQQLDSLLTSLYHQRRRTSEGRLIDFVVIVVDNGPFADSEAVIRRWEKRLLLHHHSEPRPGVSRARNAVVHAALDLDVDAIAFIDDDEVASPYWLAALVDTAARSPRAPALFAVTGPVTDVFIEGAVDPGLPSGPRRTEGESVDVAYSGNLLITTAALRRLLPRDQPKDGPFDLRFNHSGGEDAHLTRRLIAHRGLIVWSPGARVDNLVRPDDVAFRRVARRAFAGSRSAAYGRVLIAATGGQRQRTAKVGREAAVGAVGLAKGSTGLVASAVATAGGLAVGRRLRYRSGVAAAAALGRLVGAVHGPGQGWWSDSSSDDDGSLLSASGWNLLAQVTGVGASLIMLWLLSVSLGAEYFGRYAGTTALAAIISGLALFGSGDRLLLDLATPSGGSHQVWGRALGTSAMGAGLGLVAALGLGRWLLPTVPLVVLGGLALAEVSFAFVLTVSLRFGHFHGWFGWAARQQIGIAVLRVVVAALAWLLLDEPDARLSAMAVGFAVTTLAVALSTVWRVSGHAGRPKLSLPVGVGEWRPGLALGISQTSLSVTSGLDQTLLVRAGFDRDAGLYAMGARAVAYSLTPAWAVLAATYPRFFRAGRDGIEASIDYARRWASVAAGYGILAAVGLAVAVAPLVDALTAESFDGVRWIVLALAGFPILRLIQSLLGDILTSVGRFETRSAAVLVAAVANVGLNLWWIPRFGWRGAAAATYAADLLWVILLLAGVGVARRQSRGSTSGSNEAAADMFESAPARADV